MMFAWTFDASIVELIVAFLGWTGLLATGTLVPLAGLAAYLASRLNLSRAISVNLYRPCAALARTSGRHR